MTARRQIEGTVITISTDTVYLDIGYKSEGIVISTDFQPDCSWNPLVTS